MSHAGAVLVGAATSLAALAVHRSGLGWLVLAGGVSLAAAWLLGRTSRPRLAASYGLGWVLVFAVAVVGRREGDYVLASDLAGYGLTGVAFAMVALALSALTERRPPRT